VLIVCKTRAKTRSSLMVRSCGQSNFRIPVNNSVDRSNVWFTRVLSPTWLFGRVKEKGIGVIVGLFGLVIGRERSRLLGSSAWFRRE
jgi:hypothetical protein